VTVLAILNPVAGRGAAARVWRQIGGLTTRWDCATTQYRGHAGELAHAAATDGYARVVVIGGDGTISEVANGLAHSNTCLGIIAAGTGNDIARNLNIPRDPRRAAALADTGVPSTIDLGEVQASHGRRYFVNVAGLGFDAAVAHRVNAIPKRLGGTLPYVGGVLQTLWRYRSPRLRLGLDDEPREGRVFLVAVGNLQSYGGGMRIVPAARADDGLLDVCIVRHLRRLEVLRMLPRLYSGDHIRHPAVEIVRCHSVSVDGDPGVLCQADGELLGELPARFAVLPRALQCAMGPAPGSTI
jgi:diacylglycerol kinase (ATP)